MLAYRHAFHAGNHADVLKHLILVHVLAHLNAKPKGWRYVDTHSGAGAYSLRSSSARRNSEHVHGIDRLWHRTDAPPAVQAYLDAVRAAGRAAAGIGPLAPLAPPAPPAPLLLTNDAEEAAAWADVAAAVGAPTSGDPRWAAPARGAERDEARGPVPAKPSRERRKDRTLPPDVVDIPDSQFDERAFADTDVDGRMGDGLELIDAGNAPPGAARAIVDELAPPPLYPGSPALAAAFRRPQDQLMLFELHPTDFRNLAEHWGRRHGAQVRRADGFEAWPAVWPPPSRRGLMLIDPSYEVERDYVRTLQTVRAALSRFADGVIVVWIPQVSRLGARTLPRKLQAQATAARRGWLHASLTVQGTDAQGFGLAGSSVVVINPPHTLHAALAPAMPWLREALSQIARPASVLEQQLA